MKKYTLAIVVALITMTLTAQDQSIVLKTDFNGDVIEGSVENLIKHINMGKEVRVGWELDFNKDQKGDLQHWIDANFITIIGGHVFNQVDEIYTQLPRTEIPQVSMMPSDWTWTAIIGTNGVLQSRFVIPNLSSLEDEKERMRLEEKCEIRESIVPTTWVVKN